MDSGNSGSLQSSSGGDDDYDYTGPATSVHAPPPPPPSSSSSLFDTLTYFESSFPRSPQPQPPVPPPSSNTTNPFLNLESPWPRHLRPPFNPNDITGLITPSASSSTATTTPVLLQPPDPPPRVSKKRSRASRRAPTTVLTTDTSNFRAMVQEFTGIPTSPFSASTSSSPFPRSRLPRYQDSPYNNLLRPFAHKPHAAATFPPFPSSSSSSSSSSTTTTNATVTTSAMASAAASSSTNQLAHDHDHHHDHHHHHLSVSMQNQVLNFQSLLQPPITNLPSFMTTTKSQINYGHVSDQIGQQVRANLSGNLSSLVGSAEGMHSGCSEFHPEKGSDGTGRPPRSEGMVDSWICSSE